eukprot:gene18667-22333_t
MPESPERYRQLVDHSALFVDTANKYGKIIIAERHLSNEHKTIKPIQVGGIAGGKKFLCQDIMFKFPYDTGLGDETKGVPITYIYGGERPNQEKADKSATLELIGYNHYFDHATLLKLPLMAVINFHGSKLIATSRLPINNGTLVYGSDNCGVTIIASDEVVNKEMRRMAKQLNLKSHIMANVEIDAPFDVEVHRGTDGRYYMLDFARTFPPFYPGGRMEHPRQIMYRMMRPELVKANEIPLNPDSMVALSSSGATLDSIELSKACKGLLDSIPKVASDFEDALKSSDSSDLDIGKSYIREINNSLMARKGVEKNDTLQRIFEIRNLINYIHVRGLNTRHLGIFREHIKSPTIRTNIMTELVARTLRGSVRNTMRKRSASSSSGPHIGEMPKKTIVELFAALQDTTQNDFWCLSSDGNIKYSLNACFPSSLASNESIPG